MTAANQIVIPEPHPEFVRGVALTLQCEANRIPDPHEIGPDADIMIEGEERGWPWYLCDVPIEALGYMTFTPHPRADDVHEQDRFINIRSWIAQDFGGDARLALTHSPLILFYETNPNSKCRARFTLVDGWHRLKIVREEYPHFTSVPALVGICPPGVIPNYDG